MLRRIAGVITALIVAMGLMVGLSAPANAYQTGRVCKTYTINVAQFPDDTVTTCVEAQWRNQDDGAGVTLEGMWVDTTNGCSALRNHGAYTAYTNTRLSWLHPSDDNWGDNYTWYFGAEDCNYYKDLSRRGRERGGMKFRFYTEAQLGADGNNDEWVRMTLLLSPDGAWDLLYRDSGNV